MNQKRKKQTNPTTPANNEHGTRTESGIPSINRSCAIKSNAVRSEMIPDFFIIFVTLPDSPFENGNNRGIKIK